jgi:hypothetical protein
MLVDIIQLRQYDHALDREVVRATVPLRLTIDVDRFWAHSGLARPAVHASVRPMALEPLYDVHLRYWRRLNIVLSGRQRQVVPGRKSSEALYEQWWWCRIVLDSSVPPAAPIERHRQEPDYNEVVEGRTPCWLQAADS